MVAQWSHGCESCHVTSRDKTLHLRVNLPARSMAWQPVEICEIGLRWPLFGLRVGPAVILIRA